jgi:hypothetical protein
VVADQPVLHARSAGLWFLAAQAMISCTAWFIVVSRTRLDRPSCASAGWATR